MQNTQPSAIKNFQNNKNNHKPNRHTPTRKNKTQTKQTIAIALIAAIGNANDYVEMECFAKEHKQTMQKFLPIKQIPSHQYHQSCLCPDRNKIF